MQEPLAERFGDYRLQRVLGEGSSAVVYLAQDLRDRSWVALKILAPHGAGSSQAQATARAHFLQQVRITRGLQHPGIVAVHDAGESQGRLWLAMEAVPGCSLERYARGHRLLPPPLVARIGQRVALALAHAHAQGVAHRDLKPANVLVDWPSDTLKVADFGLARHAEATPTATGMLLGTPAYMAPEQLAGELPTPATDLYALGTMLFELVAGRLPHQAASMGDLLRQVAREAAPDLRTLQPGTPAPLAELIARLMAKQPSRRPSSAAHAAAALSELQGPGGSGAHPG